MDTNYSSTLTTMTTLELFDTRNTSTATTAVSVAGARKYAKQFTKNGKYYRVTVRDKNGYEEYQKGEIVSWSYPHGCKPMSKDMHRFGY
jgi:hypothetical protein